MASLINMTEDQHKEQLKKRHNTGAIFENLFRVALVVAVVALITLLIDVADEAFGTVLESFQTDPQALINDLEDSRGRTELEQLSDEELGTILMTNLGTGEFLGLIRDNIGAVEGAAFINEPMAVSLDGSTIPDEMEVDTETATIRDLSLEQQRDILVANASTANLLGWVNRFVVGIDIIDSWTLGDTLFFRGNIIEDATNDLADDVAAGGLERAGENPNRVELEAGLARFIGESAAFDAAAWYDRSVDIVVSEDNYERWIGAASAQIDTRTANVREANINFDNLETEVTATLEDEIRSALTADMADMPVEVAEEVAATFAPEFAEVAIERFQAEDPEAVSASIGADEEDLLESLVKPGLAIAIDEGTYPDASLEFRSWLNQFFLTGRGRNSIPAEASLRTAILGSMWVMLITMLTSFPLGVGAAIYLEEYADDNWLNNIIETNIRNLSGVPSIIYGILGLAIFVQALAALTSGAAFGLQETDNGRTILSAGLTLALLILPVIIINSQEAIRAVSSDIRQASYGLGATKWQTIWRQILPIAVPGILTGTILAFSRAVGETAPLIVVGAATAINSDPTNPFKAFTVIPIQIYDWTSRPQAQFRDIAAAAIIVLLILLISLNTTAILLRNRFSNRLG